jgi:TPR repeat protein
VRWYRLAADQGEANAQVNLGVTYATGAGVTQDYVQAHLWFNLSVARSTGETRERAVRGRDLAAGQLTPAALNEAQRLAREWDAAHPREP